MNPSNRPTCNSITSSSISIPRPQESDEADGAASESTQHDGDQGLSAQSQIMGPLIDSNNDNNGDETNSGREPLVDPSAILQGLLFDQEGGGGSNSDIVVDVNDDPRRAHQLAVIREAISIVQEGELQIQEEQQQERQQQRRQWQQWQG